MNERIAIHWFRQDLRLSDNPVVEQRLPHFGDYQGAMIQGGPWMYPSHISFYLNCGLLLPLECVRTAETAYHQGKAPLSAKVIKKNGVGACPFNYLYWDFLDRNREKLARNHRIGMMYKIFERMGEEKQKAIRDDSKRFLSSMT